MVLETRRHLLRELAAGDLPAVQAYAGDPEVVRYLDWGPSTPEDTVRFLALAQATRDAAPRTGYHLAITLRENGRVIGGCRIEIHSAVHAGGDIGYVLAREAWGDGHATEAAQALVRFGFERLGLHRIWATCDVDNQPSARVLEKLGMRREARLRQNVRRRGEWRDSHLYAILEPEWRERSRPT
jgi:RimJ/RimL family protein N-acetyltransferase